jgi:hypothetical protein
MGDNRAASVILACVKCGGRYQAIVTKIQTRKCICGGDLVPVPPKAKEPPVKPQ